VTRRDNHERAFLAAPQSLSPLMASQVKSSVKSGRSMAWLSLAQPSLRRPDAVAGRYPDDQGDHRYRDPARHFRARPHHRRQERPCEFEGDAVDLKAGKPTRCSLPAKISKTTPCKVAGAPPWMPYPQKHFDASGKSGALIHYRAISKTAQGAGRDHGQLRGIGCAGTKNGRPEAPNRLRGEQCRMSATRRNDRLLTVTVCSARTSSRTYLKRYSCRLSFHL
jgi:hypothetical protein